MLIKKLEESPVSPDTILESYKWKVEKTEGLILIPEVIGAISFFDAARWLKKRTNKEYKPQTIEQFVKNEYIKLTKDDVYYEIRKKTGRTSHGWKPFYTEKFNHDSDYKGKK